MSDGLGSHGRRWWIGPLFIGWARGPGPSGFLYRRTAEGFPCFAVQIGSIAVGAGWAA
jgi:hypothetical protein